VIKGYTHVGHIVKDINNGINLYTRILGLKPNLANITQIPGGKAFMIRIGNNSIELIEPTDSRHRVGQFLERHGEGWFHISFRVDDIKLEVQSLRQQGVIVEDPREITTLPSRPKIAFIDPQSVYGAIIELAEEPQTRQVKL
jgi:methylmalonyl-CoA/ethylmalonyl-CoA epimerase